jgi:hypothetical protein
MAAEMRTIISIDQHGGSFRPSSRITVFERVRFVGVDFGGTRFEAFNVQGSYFEACSFKRARLLGGCLGGFWAEPATYVSCDFTRASLRLIPGEVLFERCIFDHSNINGWQTDACSFVDCTFVGPISGVIFYGTSPVWIQREDPPAPNEFIGNNFSAAEFTGVEFRRGVDLSRQILPASDDYVYVDDIRKRVLAAIPIVSGWPVTPETNFALDLLEKYTNPELYFPGQAAMLRANNVKDAGRAETLRRVYELIASINIE